MDTAIVCAGVVKRYGAGVLAVGGVSLAVARGEKVLVRGPSGAGKTTLLRLIAGLERVDEGTVLIDGACCSGPGRHVPARRRGIGLVFQDLALWPHLTAEQQLDLVLRGGPWSRRGRRERVGRLLGLLGLEPRARHVPGRLSGGERRRLALARGLAWSPRILLLDEPFAELDQELQEDLALLVLRERSDPDLTTVVVSHGPPQLAGWVDRVIEMREGAVLEPVGRARSSR